MTILYDVPTEVAIKLNKMVMDVIEDVLNLNFEEAIEKIDKEIVKTKSVTGYRVPSPDVMFFEGFEVTLSKSDKSNDYVGVAHGRPLGIKRSIFTIVKPINEENLENKTVIILDGILRRSKKDNRTYFLIVTDYLKKGELPDTVRQLYSNIAIIRILGTMRNVVCDIANEVSKYDSEEKKRIAVISEILNMPCMHLLTGNTSVINKPIIKKIDNRVNAVISLNAGRENNIHVAIKDDNFAIVKFSVNLYDEAVYPLTIVTKETSVKKCFYMCFEGEPRVICYRNAIVVQCNYFDQNFVENLVEALEKNKDRSPVSSVVYLKGWYLMLILKDEAEENYDEIDATVRNELAKLGEKIERVKYSPISGTDMYGEVIKEIQKKVSNEIAEKLVEMC